MNHIQLIDGDITTAHVDAIVNAANPLMLGGGGVDGAIHRAAGPALLEACRQVKPVDGIRCPFGSARITSAGNLNAKYVIHAVGPIYRNEAAPEQRLEEAYASIFQLASAHDCQSIAIPAISCGAYGFPLEPAAFIAIKVSVLFPDINIQFYLRGNKVMTAWQRALSTITAV